MKNVVHVIVDVEESYKSQLYERLLVLLQLKNIFKNLMMLVQEITHAYDLS